MDHNKISQDEALIRKILSALAWNKINIATALIETDRMSSEQIVELDRFLQDNNGEITEDQFLEIAHKVNSQDIMTN